MRVENQGMPTMKPTNALFERDLKDDLSDEKTLRVPTIRRILFASCSRLLKLPKSWKLSFCNWRKIDACLEKYFQLVMPRSCCLLVIFNDLCGKLRRFSTLKQVKHHSQTCTSGKMTDYMAQMLNELMGPQRNSFPGESASVWLKLRNTENVLGFCPFPIHDEALKKRYRESHRHGRLGCEEKYLERLFTISNTHVSSEVCDRKKKDINERREVLGRKTEGLMQEAEIEGQQGNVGTAQKACRRRISLR
ncbi:unnamed protein product [Cylicocyclus nassatus]|uniref:Uncharacterized protein n=1 Tax=Cylicocyclus nassatus TaxID=53992 RepID=A0AA36GTM5_CYLNA|nr:unnamed protein product [Cylicocyclus nassatus]